MKELFESKNFFMNANKLWHASLGIKSLNATLINALFIKPIDEKLIKRLLKYETIIIYNPYSTRYGLVNLICSTLMKFNYKGKVVTKCVDDKFVDHATINEQLDSMKINIKHIISLLK